MSTASKMSGTIFMGKTTMKITGLKIARMLFGESGTKGKGNRF